MKKEELIIKNHNNKLTKEEWKWDDINNRPPVTLDLEKLYKFNWYGIKDEELDEWDKKIINDQESQFIKDMIKRTEERYKKYLKDNYDLPKPK